MLLLMIILKLHNLYKLKSYDKNVKILSLKEGDLVLLRDTTTKKGKSKKLATNYTGPYDIIKKISDKIYTIRAHGSKNYKNAKCKH